MILISDFWANCPEKARLIQTLERAYTGKKKDVPTFQLEYKTAVEGLKKWGNLITVARNKWRMVNGLFT